MLRLVDRNCRPVRQYHARRHEVVSHESIAALQPSVAAAQHRRREASAIAAAGHRLLSEGPEPSNHFTDKVPPRMTACEVLVGERETPDMPRI